MRRNDLIIFIGVIIMVFILFIAYIVASFFASQEPQPSASPTPTRSTLPSNNLTPTAPSLPLTTTPSLPPTTTILTREEILNLLPLQTDTYDIEYLSVSDHFVVTIKKNPYAENKTQIENWFKEFGLEPNSLNIYWNAYPEVKR